MKRYRIVDVCPDPVLGQIRPERVACIFGYPYHKLVINMPDIGSFVGRRDLFAETSIGMRCVNLMTIEPGADERRYAEAVERLSATLEE